MSGAANAALNRRGEEVPVMLEQEGAGDSRREGERMPAAKAGGGGVGVGVGAQNRRLTPVGEKEERGNDVEEKDEEEAEQGGEQGAEPRVDDDHDDDGDGDDGE